MTMGQTQRYSRLSRCFRARSRRGAGFALGLAIGLTAWLNGAPGWRDGEMTPHLTGADQALALDMDLQRPMFRQPARSRAQQSLPNAAIAVDPRYRRAPTYPQAQPRGFIESLFGAPQRPQYQPGARPRQPASARPARKEPRRTVHRPVAPPAVRPAVEKSEFVYLLEPEMSVSAGAGHPGQGLPGQGLLGEGLGTVLADRPIVAVRSLRFGGDGAPEAARLLAPLPATLAPGGKSAVLVVTAAPDWGKLPEAQLQALVTEVSAAMTARQAPVVWVGLPPAADKAESARAAAVNGVLRAAADKSGGGFVDAWAVFADDSGSFAAWGPAVSGEIVRLREDSNGALTKAGARKLAHFIVVELRRIQARVAGGAKPQIAVPVDPFSLPGPQLPAVEAVAPSKPDVGPVTPLNVVITEPGGKLDPLDASRRELPDVTARKALQDGAPAVAAPGRADDFRWPRPGG